MRLAVLGSPVKHSLSPVMQRAALAAAHLEGTYEAIDVDGRGFGDAVVAIRRKSLDGANVTMPHKHLAYELCDVPSPLAERVGAVNTLTHLGGEVLGDNTDVAGIRRAWDWAGLGDEPVVVLGSGGAAAAALLALEGRDLTVRARRPDAAKRLVERTGVAAAVGEWDAAVEGSVVVNATPVGMRGEELDERLLRDAVGLFDMAYGDSETPAVAEMRRRGVPVAEGLDMLVGQALASFRIWTGIEIDSAVMRDAAQAELERRREVHRP